MSLIYCPRCGGNVSEYAKGCPSCGYIIDDNVELKSAREQNASEKAVDMRLCKTCGSILLRDSLYCFNCGNKVEDLNIDNQKEKELSVNEDSLISVDNLENDSVVKESSIVDDDKEDTKSKNGKKLIIGVILCLIIIVGLYCGVENFSKAPILREYPSSQLDLSNKDLKEINDHVWNKSNILNHALEYEILKLTAAISKDWDMMNDYISSISYETVEFDDTNKILLHGIIKYKKYVSDKRKTDTEHIYVIVQVGGKGIDDCLGNTEPNSFRLKDGTKVFIYGTYYSRVSEEKENLSEFKSENAWNQTYDEYEDIKSKWIEKQKRKEEEERVREQKKKEEEIISDIYSRYQAFLGGYTELSYDRNRNKLYNFFAISDINEDGRPELFIKTFRHILNDNSDVFIDVYGSTYQDYSDVGVIKELRAGEDGEYELTYYPITSYYISKIKNIGAGEIIEKEDIDESAIEYFNWKENELVNSQHFDDEQINSVNYNLITGTWKGEKNGYAIYAYIIQESDESYTIAIQTKDYEGKVIEDWKMTGFYKRDYNYIQCKNHLKTSKTIAQEQIVLESPTSYLKLDYNDLKWTYLGKEFGSDSVVTYFNLKLSDEVKYVEDLKEGASGVSSVEDYIIPGIDTRYITEKDLEGLDATQCLIARNEIYARHGRKFDNPELQEYFNSKSWYTPLYDPTQFDASVLNEYELVNAETIRKYEKSKGWTNTSLK